MSSSILQAIWPGEKHEDFREFRNSWGTAPIVWGTFCTKYLGKEDSWWLINAQSDSGK